MSLSVLLPLIAEAASIAGVVASFIKYVKDNSAREATQNLRLDALERKVELQDTNFLALSTQLANIQASLASIQTDLTWLKGNNR